MGDEIARHRQPGFERDRAREGAAMKAKPDKREEEALEEATKIYESYAKHDKEALEWAIGFFRGCAAELKGDRRTRDVADLQRLIVRSLRHDEEDMAEYMRAMGEFAAAQMERGKQLSDSVRDVVIRILRNPSIVERRRTGPNPTDLDYRDIKIVEAISCIVEMWDFLPTRGEGKNKGDSAASIVQRALKLGAGISMEETTINKIWAYSGHTVASSGRRTFRQTYPSLALWLKDFRKVQAMYPRGRSSAHQKS